MNKLRLDVDEVTVESFATAAGEMRAHGEMEEHPSGLPCTRLTMCPCTPLAG